MFYFFFHRSEVKVAQLCPTLWDPMDCSLPGSYIHGILQATILEWVAMPPSGGSSQPRDRTQVSHIVGRFFTSSTKLYELKLYRNLGLSLPVSFNKQISGWLFSCSVACCGFVALWVGCCTAGSFLSEWLDFLFVCFPKQLLSSDLCQKVVFLLEFNEFFNNSDKVHYLKFLSLDIIWEQIQQITQHLSQTKWWQSPLIRLTQRLIFQAH